MKRKSDAKTAAEVMAELAADPQFRARQRDQEEALNKKVLEWRKSERPLIRDLRQVGLSVGSVWDLVNTTTPYPQAIPILLTHLTLPYPQRVREGIARALAVPESKIGWNVLLDLFRSEPDETTVGVKWALGCVLAASADIDVLDDLIAVVNERRHGLNRAALLPALMRLPDPRAKATLASLREDPQLSDEVRRLTRRRVPKK
jgi:HEAT repeat protein